jgi:hypothetical protein
LAIRSNPSRTQSAISLRYVGTVPERQGATCTETCTLGLARRSRPSKLLASNNGAWRSPVARLLWEQEVPGSNPGAPIC